MDGSVQIDPACRKGGNSWKESSLPTDWGYSSQAWGELVGHQAFAITESGGPLADVTVDTCDLAPLADATGPVCDLALFADVTVPACDLAPLADVTVALATWLLAFLSMPTGSRFSSKL